MTRDDIWPTFDGWCVTQGIDPWDVPSYRWCNLVYFFATRNMDQKQRDKFDGAMSSVHGEWIKLRVRGIVRDRVKVIESESRDEPVESTTDPTPTQLRERRLPPKPAWYGTREQATMSSLAAKQTLTSRGGKSTGRR